MTEENKAPCEKCKLYNTFSKTCEEQCRGDYKTYALLNGLATFEDLRNSAK